MEFDPTQPIWLQLVDEFSRRISVGIWPAGQRIPGVRDLAGDLAVNPNTVQRALAELERRDLCRSERTSGRFVTEDSSRITALRQELAVGAADEFVTRARGFGLSLDAAQGLVGQLWESTAPPTKG